MKSKCNFWKPSTKSDLWKQSLSDGGYCSWCVFGETHSCCYVMSGALLDGAVLLTDYPINRTMEYQYLWMDDMSRLDKWKTNK